MTSKLCRTLCIVATSLCIASVAHAAIDAATARKELTALYNQYGRLLKQQFRYPLKQWFLKHTTEEYVLKQGGKSYTREEAAEQMEEGTMAMMSFTRHDLKITSLSVKGNQVVVLYKDRAAAVMPDPSDEEEERMNKVVLTSTTRETWLKSPEGWLIKSTEVLTSQTMVNGKLIRPRPTRKR